MESLKEDGKLNSSDITHEEKSPLSEECLPEVTVTERISTEDAQLSLTDVSVIAIRSSDTVKCDLHKKKESLLTEKEQPKPHTLLPASQVRSEDSLKTSRAHSIPPDETDTCAALLLACLFCQPMDCLLATVKGCNECLCWFCSSFCGCEASVLQPLLDMSHHCELYGCLGARCSLCDCPICDICLQATECLDLAMEISQMIYH